MAVLWLCATILQAQTLTNWTTQQVEEKQMLQVAPSDRGQLTVSTFARRFTKGSVRLHPTTVGDVTFLAMTDVRFTTSATAKSISTLLIKIVGIARGGQQVAPQWQYFGRRPESIQFDDTQLRITAFAGDEIFVVFDKAVQYIDIEVVNEQDDPAFQAKITFDALLTVNETDIVRNTYTRDACSRRAALAIDGSSSVSTNEATELSDLIRPLAAAFNDLTILSFGTGIKQKSDKMAYANQGEQVASNTDFTDWLAVLQAAKEQKADVLILVTDGPPNTENGQKKPTISTFYAAIKAANMVKKAGTVIQPMGVFEFASFGRLWVHCLGSSTVKDTQNLTDVLLSNVCQTAPQTSNIRLTPNPARDRLLISVATDTALTAWQVTDMNGRTLLKGNSSELDITMLPPGQYLCMVQLGESWETERFVKL